MPTYALLGATGATGSSVLRHLLETQSASLQLNLLVRSKSKLLSAIPDLETRRAPKIHIIQADSTNPDALDTCIHQANVVFMCVAQNGSPTGTTLVQDTVAAVIEALRRRQTQHPCPPTVIQLRSASLNPALAAQVPRFVHRLVSSCLFAGYADLRRACSFYEQARREQLLEYVLVDPPTLHDADGVQPTGYRLITTEAQAITLSYADLGVALCEIADRARQFQGLAVGVTATGPVKQNWGVLAGYLVQGGVDHLDYRYGRENMVVVGFCIVLVLVCLLAYL
ncbi:hypothetical protein BDW59DRAFT_181611 [Aspergillus cavernicola]|uniref:NAD(P)-binding domain-containing protein n=1 Tax=Aspergillus cavernicola TaxID=176166 RepID=A0ABR4HVW0_9EURO